MSTKSMQQSKSEFPAVLPFPAGADNGSIDCLIVAADIHPDDHVMVIGRQLSAHLVALAHCGCQSATGGDPDSLYMRKDPADVAWITGVAKIEGRVASAVLHMEGLRLVVIELTATQSMGRLRAFLRQLRDAGLVRQSYRRAADRLLVTAHRLERAQWAA